MTFDASASTPGHDANDRPYSGITNYEWDLDGNSSFETVTQSPTVTHRYGGTGSTEVTDSNGGQGKTANTVTTSSDTGETASIHAGLAIVHMEHGRGVGRHVPATRVHGRPCD